MKNAVAEGVGGKTSILRGEDDEESSGVNEKRAKCLQRNLSQVGRNDARMRAKRTYFGMFQFLLPFSKLSFELTHMPVILRSFLLTPCAPTPLKCPGMSANSSYDPTGVSE